MTAHTCRLKRSARGTVTGKMVRVMASLPPDDMRRLVWFAEQQQVPASKLLRDAVVEFLDQRDPRKWKGQAGIYALTCLLTNRKYIGSAVDLYRRWREHTRLLAHGRHYNHLLQDAWGVDGHITMAFKPLLFCSRGDLLRYEQRALDILSPELNLAPTAGSSLGYKATPETKAKLSTIARSRSPEMRAKLSEGQRKRAPPTAETRAKLSAKGKGRPHSDAHRAAISAALKGRTLSLETRAKLSIARRANILLPIAVDADAAAEKEAT